MSLIPAPGDQPGQKTSLKVYNPAGFSIEFAMVRSSPQRFDCVLSIVVWCGVLPHHQYQCSTVYAERMQNGVTH
jgi:hypothetical protein